MSPPSVQLIRRYRGILPLSAGHGPARRPHGLHRRRHPELSSGKGTIRITPKAAEGISDGELRALVKGALRG